MASATPPPPAPASALNRACLRVVLFGMPDAGKSSLLGALAQASQTQERTLRGRLADVSHGLEELRRRVYEERPRETLEEIVPYPVTYERFTPGHQPAPATALPALLIDCDGRVANELLTQRKPLDDATTEAGLGRSVLAADALVLVIDAAAGPEQIDADFTEFARFLKLLQRHRVRRSEVGGLPVFLVLSKCDLLARPGDSAVDWAARINERQRQVRERFEDFLKGAEEGGTDPLPFGQIDLSVAATAVKRPALTGAPPAEREPYGVAELFRDTLAAAEVYRDRARRSQRRLAWTIAGAAGALLAMTLAAVFFVFYRGQDPPLALQSKIDVYRANEGQTASTRLAEPLLRKFNVLREFHQDPDFAKLPAETRDYVDKRLAELQAYQEYKDRFQSVRPPGEAISLDELDALEKRLREELAPPREHASEWAQTDQVTLRDKWLTEDVAAMRAAAAEVEDWYTRLRQDADQLLTERPGAGVAWEAWLGRLNQLLARAEKRSFRDTDPLPKTRPLPALRSPAPTYAAVLGFPGPARTRAEWDRARQTLERLRDVSAALGLTPEQGPQQAPLAISGRFTAAQAAARLRSLKQSYPRYAEWSLAGLPESVQAPLRRAAENSYQNLIAAGQEAILAYLLEIGPDGRETPARWQAVADWAGKSPDLADWRELTAVVARLADPRADDPVTALVNFLRKDRFELEIRRVRVPILDDLKADRLTPDGDLTVYRVPPGEGATRTVLTYKKEADVPRDSIRGLSTYTFAAEGTGRLEYRPGDNFWAELPLTDPRGGKWKLTWALSRTQSYQFERLSRPPRLHRANEDLSAGPRAEAVILTVLPDDGVPKVPDLLPTVVGRGR